MVRVVLSNGKTIDITYGSIIKLYAIGCITFSLVLFVFYMLFWF